MSKQYKEEIEIEPIAKEQLLLYPQEQMSPVQKKKQTLRIGIPKENSTNERRVALLPEAVNILVRRGHEVIFETEAGKQARLEDHEYSEAGAIIAHNTKEVFECDIVLKVEPPTQAELEMMKNGKTLISTIQFATLGTEYLKTILKKKIIAVAYELIEDKVGTIPIMRAMSEIAGSTVMLIAAEYLSSPWGGKGIIVGGITGVPPTKVVILGAGTVAEYAARMAVGLGAEIKIFDTHIYKLRRLKYAIGHDCYTSTIDPVLLSEAISRADVVIGAVRAERGRSPIIITEEMVAKMRPNSVMIDVSIDQGGCIETSEITTLDNPVFKKYDIIHYCVPNIASRVARTSSTALSNIFAPFLMEIGECGGTDEMIFSNKWFMKGVYTFKGSLTNEYISNKFKIPYKDLSLLMAARW